MSDVLHHQVDRHQSSSSWVVLIHGLFGDGDNLSAARRHLRTDHNIITVDLPDHGLSPQQTKFTVANAADSVLSVIDQYALETASVLGHSLGGKVAMMMALSAPDRISRLVAADIAPVAYRQRHNTVFKGLNNVDLTHISGRRDADSAMAEYIEEPGVRQFLLKSLYRNENNQWQWRFNLEGLEQQYGEISGWPDIQASFNKPVLFVKGGNSDYLTRDHQNDISRYFPNATAKIIQGAGHWLHAEKPTVFNRIVSEFLTAG